MKKIAFIGTHGTGKTTLAHELVSDLKKQGLDADFLGEVARSCPFPINEEATKKSQFWIILSQIIKEMENEDKTEVLICDRSVLDPYVYYVSKFGRVRAIEDLVKKHLSTYSMLIKVPIKPGLLREDKVRSTNPEFQNKIDSLMNKLLKSMKINYYDYTNLENIKKSIIK